MLRLKSVMPGGTPIIDDWLIVGFQLAQELGELILCFQAHAVESWDDPLLVLGRHAAELPLSLRRQLHRNTRRSAGRFRG